MLCKHRVLIAHQITALAFASFRSGRKRLARRAQTLLTIASPNSTCQRTFADLDTQSVEVNADRLRPERPGVPALLAVGSGK